MKLLFDQNLSFRLPQALADIYQGALHVRHLALTCPSADASVDYPNDAELAVAPEPAQRMLQVQPIGLRRPGEP